jgi:hypothetical protein
MVEPTLEFIGQGFERVLAELRELRAEVHGLRGELRETRADLTVLTNLYFGLARDMVLIKEMLGRFDARITKLEDRLPI